MELRLKNVTKNYGNKSAVKELDITFYKGVYGLLGANGAGKTTLMRMICGVLEPTEGEILFDGNSAKLMGENYRKLLGYTPQNFGYYPDYTAQEFMQYIAALKGIPKTQAKKQIRQILDLVSLFDVSKKKIKTYSGGMKQRLGIAQAILGNPKILILDEPTAGLDPKERVKFRNLIADLAKDKIVILSTHIVSDIEYIADYILLMKDGKLMLNETAGDITARINGKVWQCEVEERETERISYEYCVVNMQHNQKGCVVMRIVSEEKPDPNAVLIEPVLEDLYMYYFQKEQGRE